MSSYNPSVDYPCCVKANGLSMPCLSDLVVWIIHNMLKQLGSMDYPCSVFNVTWLYGLSMLCLSDLVLYGLSMLYLTDLVVWIIHAMFK